MAGCCFESYADNDKDHPACPSENHRVSDIIKAQEQGRDLHEQFHRQACVCLSGGGGFVGHKGTVVLRDVQTLSRA